MFTNISDWMKIIFYVVINYFYKKLAAANYYRDSLREKKTCNVIYDDIDFSMETTLICWALVAVGDFGMHSYHYCGEGWVNVKLSYIYNDDFQKENTFVIS